MVRSCDGAAIRMEEEHEENRFGSTSEKEEGDKTKMEICVYETPG